MWAALSKFVEEDDYENIVKTCTAALEEGGAEAKSALDGRLRASLLRAICVAKIYMEDFEGALKSAEEAVASAKNEPPCIAYEKAYCLMRLGRLKDALATAVEGEANDAVSIALLNLSAQGKCGTGYITTHPCGTLSESS